MIGNKKALRQIQEEREQLELEKQELLFIKEQLEDTSPKVDISNLYIWKDKGIYSIVRLDVSDCRGRAWGGVGKMVDGYQSTLTDIFTNKVIYEKTSVEKINNKEYISGNTLENSYYAYFYPIHCADRNLLAYTDKIVPLYVLQQLYYKLNNVDLNAKVLKKEK